MTDKEYETHCFLNKLYEPVIILSDSVKCTFESKSFEVKAMFANKHYTEHNGKFLIEYYPLRVLDIKNVGDLVFSFTDITFERYFEAKQILSLNLEKIVKHLNKQQLDFYSESNCCKSLYKNEMSAGKLRQNIKGKGIEKIAINFQFKDVEKDIQFILENLIPTLSNNKTK